MRPWRTSHRIVVFIEDFPFVFEPDEERNFGAVVAGDDYSKAEKVDSELLRVVAETLHKLFS